MNDKILQLLVQSGLLINVSDHRVCELDPNIKKFAELIVKECSQISKDYQRNYYESHGARIAKKIKEHFGVKE